MVDREPLRSQQIHKWFNQLISVGETEREHIFADLCSYTNKEDVDIIYATVIERGDVHSVHWLIRYLIQIEHTYSFEKLLALLQNESSVIRQEACAGIANIMTDIRVDLLIKMLDSSFKDVIRFAAKQLGEIGRTVAIGSLLKVLRENDDEDVQIDILRVLGKLKYPQSITTLEYVAEHSFGRVQKEALSTLGKFASWLQPRFLKRCLISQHSLRREIAYLTILRSNNRSWEKAMAKAFHQEVNKRLQVKILSSIRNIFTKEFFDVILNLALHNKSIEVKVMAQSVLRRVKSQRMLNWIVDAFGEGKDANQELVLRLLGEYSYQPKTLEIIMNIYIKTEEQRLRLITLDLLGRVREQKVRHFLLNIIKEGNNFSYAATVSLCEILNPDGWPIIEEILAMDQENMSAVIQVVLNFIHRLPISYTIPKSIETLIEQLIDSRNPTIRYLAIRCFARNHCAERLRKLLLILVEDPYPMIKSVCLTEIVNMVSNNPRYLTVVLTICLFARDLFPVVAKLFREVSVRKEDDFKYIIVYLLDLIQKQEAAPQKEFPVSTDQMITLIKDQIMKEKSIFMNLLEQGDWNDGERCSLLKALNQTELHHLGGLKVDFMVQQYFPASKKTKREFLEFFGKLPTRSSYVENAVFASLLREEDHDLQNKVNAVLSDWMTISKFEYRDSLIP